MKQLIIYIVLFFSLNNHLTAQEKVEVIADTVSIPTPMEVVKSRLQKLEKDPALKNASWSFALYDPKREKMILAKNETMSLIPASNTKILTCGSALELLGNDFTFKTKIAYSGYVSEDGILNGDLFIIGGGDPTLGSGHLGALGYNELLDIVVKAIQNHNIKNIAGNIIADISMFRGEDDMLPPDWTWRDMGNYYCAAPSALTVNDNAYSVTFQTGIQKGDKAKIIDIDPDEKELDIEIINKVITDDEDSDDNTYIYGAPDSKKRYISGTLPANHTVFTIKGALPNPPRTFTLKLRDKLKLKGIEITGELEERTLVDHIHPEKYEQSTILIIPSPPLIDIVKFTMETSNNLYAEHLLKTLGYTQLGIGSTQKGLDVIYQYFDQIKLNKEGFKMADGSGLSRSNVITSVSQIDYLRYYMKQPLFESFYHSFALSGETGTVRRMFLDSPAQGKIRAKTGTLNGVKTLAGYIETKSGDILCFSLLFNNFNCSISQIKSKMEYLLTPIVGF